MPIYDQSYAHWDGELEGRLLRWLPITLNAIRLAFRSKLFLIVFCLSLAPFVFRVGMIYIFSFAPRLGSEPGIAKFVQIDGTFYCNFLVRDQFISVVLMCLFVGCAQIARDLKVRALEIYFSKPLTLLDYLAGKFGAIGFFLLCMTLFPGLLLFVSDFLLSDEGTVADQAQFIPGILATSALVVSTLSLVVLAASALCRTTRNAALVWIGFHLALMISGQIMAEIFRMPFLAMIDIRVSLQYLAQIVFDVERDFQIPGIFPFLYILLINLSAGWVLLHRVRKVEATET